MYGRAPWWDPRYWGKRVWIGLAVVIVIIIAIIVGVVVSRNNANRYPDYTVLSYSLADTYSGESFFDKFNYFYDYDPTHGFVHYANREQAQQMNLTFASSERAVLRVDAKTGPSDVPNASTGRLSARVESKTQYNQGLFLFDVKHSPYGCGTWPALWLTDPNNWPEHGEIDVLESVNLGNDGNNMALHTSDNCNMNVKRIETGSAGETDCNANVPGSKGCTVLGPKQTYGEDFNSQGGGLVAMEWRNEGIRVWQFAQSAVPSDITNKRPDPSTWGTALADFPNTRCDTSSHFTNQSIIINISLCGDWAGAPDIYSKGGCPGNCTSYVADNPTAFEQAYWEFGAFEVYKAS